MIFFYPASNQLPSILVLPVATPEKFAPTILPPCSPHHVVHRRRKAGSGSADVARSAPAASIPMMEMLTMMALGTCSAAMMDQAGGGGGDRDAAAWLQCHRLIRG